MRYKNGNDIQRIITGDDVIITSGTNSLSTVDEAIEKQQKEIDKLKSNMKYIYSYGGVGGTGSGGGTTNTKDPVLYIEIDGKKLTNGDILVLSGPGSYDITINVRNGGGETFYVKLATGSTKIEDVKNLITLTPDNLYTQVQKVSLKNNGTIKVQFLDSSALVLDSINTDYIVNAHTFAGKLMYHTEEGSSQVISFSSDDYNYVLGDLYKIDPFIDISYTINLTNVTNINVTYSISDIDEREDKGVINYDTTDISKDHTRIYLKDLLKKGLTILDETNSGTYSVKMKLEYTYKGNLVDNIEPIEFDFTIIPAGFFINAYVQNSKVLYDNNQNIIDEIETSTDTENKLPNKYIIRGQYLNLYVKVFDGIISDNPNTYSITLHMYDYLEDENKFSETEIEENGRTISVIQGRESSPYKVAFSTPGIKKLVFTSGLNGKRETIKYLYVKKGSSTLNWYNSDKWTPSIDHFYRSQQEIVYSNNFPKSIFNETKGEILISESDTGKGIELTHTSWQTPLNEKSVTTVLSFGIQYNYVNKDGATILDVYSDINDSEPSYTLKSNSFKKNITDILIPYTTDFDKTKRENYHLVQIVRTQVDKNSGGTPTYVTTLYIDGIPEAVDNSTKDNQLNVAKIVLNRVNVAYNLINIQYIANSNPSLSEMEKTPNPTTPYFNIDEYIYYYWLTFKERMRGETISDEEKYVLINIDSFKFIKDNVIISGEDRLTVLNNLASNLNIPIMKIRYEGKGTTADYENFTSALFLGYTNGDNGKFGSRNVSISYSPGKKTLSDVIIPSDSIRQGSFMLDLQGTSTMRNRIKNFSLSVLTQSTDETEQILFSPNFDKNDNSTFLPEKSWTLKADITDSAHANNTSIGRFVNTVSTKFRTTMNLSPGASGFIKNTLQGFPFLMFMEINDKIYYFGVYNFNMGRDSHYNLGYCSDVENVYEKMCSDTQISSEHGFKFTTGKCVLENRLVVGEIADNYAEFDFHQFDDTVLFMPDVEDNKNHMFGDTRKPSDRFLCTNVSSAKTTLKNFVKAVAKAGAYCFANIGKEFCDINYNEDGKLEDTNTSFTNWYETRPNCVSNVKHQLYYEGGVPKFKEDVNYDPEVLKNDYKNLLELTETNFGEEIKDNTARLDYTSASEYFVICLAFGLVDSVMKNMNIKSWNGDLCYCAFYDMDTAFGVDNAGYENVSYMVGSDYWYSETNAGLLGTVNVKWDYWDNVKAGKGLDFTSSYLFAVVKYAQALVKANENTSSVNYTHYPQEFWAILRGKNGELRSAQHFIDNYFKSGIHIIPTYLTNLNYNVKYFYNETNNYIANASQFNGSRTFKVYDWLNKRLHFLDMTMNVMDVSIPIYSGINLPAPPTTLSLDLMSNSDVVILTDAFTTENLNETAINVSNASLKVQAPENTPFIVKKTSTSDIYLLNADRNSYNEIQYSYSGSKTIRFYGSKSLTNIDKVEYFFTNYYTIDSDKLEEVKYGETAINTTTLNSGYTINSSSVRNISLPIPGMSGELSVIKTDTKGQAVTKIDISGSSMFGTFDGLSNLSEVNISSVNISDNNIKILNCPKVNGDKFTISGKTSDEKTCVKNLEVTGTYGHYKIMNSEIENIAMIANAGEVAEFEIYSDYKIKKLSLTGFRKIIINDCVNLEELTINDTDQNKVEEIHIVLNTNADTTGILTSINSIDNTFDFTKYTDLDILEIVGCNGVECIKLPNREVKVESMSNNFNLEFIDTEGEKSKLVIVKKSTFMNCPCYGMRQSIPSGTVTDETGSKDPARIGKYTKMTISDDSIEWVDGKIDLSNTFGNASLYSISSKYDEPMEEYYDGTTRNKAITITDAGYFLKNVISDDKKPKVSNLSKCFMNRQSIVYSKSYAYKDDYENDEYAPDMSKFTGLENISEMYRCNGSGDDKGITFISKKLLSFPAELNSVSNPLNWKNFTNNNRAINIAMGALENISYRIDDVNEKEFTVYVKGTYKNKKDEDVNDYIVGYNSEDNYLDIKDFLCIKVDEETGENITFDNIKSVSNFSINPNQYVDYIDLFNVCPNVETITNFLNQDLSRTKIDGLFQNCTNIVSIKSSLENLAPFSSSFKPVDLMKFYNWTSGNTEITDIFSILGNESPMDKKSLYFKKYVEFSDFKTILNCLVNYNNITSISNIFSLCEIRNYDGSEIIIPLKSDNTKNTKIKFIDHLFNGTTAKDSTDSTGYQVPLNIRRSFFMNLPNVESMVYSFSDICLDHMFSLDMFCKYGKETEKTVFVGENKNISAKLKTKSYSTTITDMRYCFYRTRFQNCLPYFDINDEINDNLINESDEVIYVNGEKSDYTEYTLSSNRDNVIKISKSTTYTDCVNNFTNYIKDFRVDRPGGQSYVTFKNHNLNMPKIVINENEVTSFTTNDFGVYPTYCCLPSDILYACHPSCKLEGVFADSNIIGVLPKHLLKNANGVIPNIFRNTNILPNVYYHYKSVSDDKKSEYLELIQNIPVDNSVGELDDVTLVGTTDDDAVVLFRDSEGVLKRRYPKESGEYEKSQFVYVPDEFADLNDLSNSFNFRYNLPNNSSLKSEAFTWYPGGGKELDVENHPEFWNYYVQYFFTTTNSVKWKNVTYMKSPFIEDVDDKVYTDFSNNGNYYNKQYCTTDRETESQELRDNTWSSNDDTGNTPTYIFRYDTDGVFNSFLNICGKKQVTGELVDNGCPFDFTKGRIYIMGLLTGNLVAFTNGWVLTEDIDIAQLWNNECITDNIIKYSGYARNIKLPKFENSVPQLPGNIPPSIPFINSGDYCKLFAFMFNSTNTMNQYKTYVFNGSNNIIEMLNTVKYQKV